MIECFIDNIKLNNFVKNLVEERLEIVYKSKDLTVRLGEEGRVVSNKEFKVIVIK